MAIGTATVNPELPPAAERLRYEEYLPREKANAVIRGFVSEGDSIKEIVRRTGHSRKLFRSFEDLPYLAQPRYTIAIDAKRALVLFSHGNERRPRHQVFIYQSQ
jgi:hypothetical protein